MIPTSSAENDTGAEVAAPEMSEARGMPREHRPGLVDEPLHLRQPLVRRKCPSTGLQEVISRPRSRTDWAVCDVIMVLLYLPAW